jgi:SNF2 family DNA or RNA helicase
VNGPRFEVVAGKLAVEDDELGTIARRLRRRGIPFRRRHGRLTVEFAHADALAACARCSEDAKRYAQNRRVVAVGREVRARQREVLEGGPGAARKALADVADRVGRLDPHQLIGVAVLTTAGSWGGCVFDEQGTGKTVTTMAAFDVLCERGQADLMLVVSPKSMLHEWVAEFKRFYGDLYKVCVLEGARRQRREVLESGADVLITNYEAVGRHSSDLRLLARRRRFPILVVDESFLVKNPDAARTAAIRELREWVSQAWVLCGTPAPNHPRDLAAQFDLVDFGHAFGELAIDDDRETAATQVRGRLNDAIWLRSRKADVLDLPARTFADIVVPMAPLQRAAYDQAADGLLADLQRASDGEFARNLTHFLQRRAALLQIASNPGAVVPGYDETPGKTEALWRLVASLVAHGEKVVVWAFYRANLDSLEKLLRVHGLVRIDGSIDAPSRRAAVAAFQTDPNTRIFLGNPAAAGAGLTLHAARHAVYESLSNQAAHYLQSLDRIHRRGQTRPVTYHTLLSEGTIEIPEYDRLVAKARNQADLLGDRDPRPDRRNLIAELRTTVR